MSSLAKWAAKKGKADSFKEFLKQHKGKLAAGAGATTLGGAAAYANDDEEEDEEEESGMNKLLKKLMED